MQRYRTWVFLLSCNVMVSVKKVYPAGVNIGDAPVLLVLIKVSPCVNAGEIRNIGETAVESKTTQPEVQAKGGAVLQFVPAGTVGGQI